MKKIVGRSADCEIVIIDPENRVSRRHAQVSAHQGKIYIRDLKSLNGTYVNGKKIEPEKDVLISASDRVTFSTSYVYDTASLFSKKWDDDETKLLRKDQDAGETTILMKDGKITMTGAQKTVIVDSDKTTISDLSSVDQTRYKTIGRATGNDHVIENANISRQHCKLRMLAPMIIEVMDLGSTNGTFADGVKLTPNKLYQFNSAVEIRLGSSFRVDLKKIFPDIQIVKKATPPSQPSVKNEPALPPRGATGAPAPITREEQEKFNELQALWKEYFDRQNEISNSAFSYAAGGTALGLAAAAVMMPFTGGLSGLLFAGGGGLLGKYFGQQKSNEIRGDMNYENMFLETYCCPRCKESFQKKPWITIRECFKCKLKFGKRSVVCHFLNK